MRAVELQIANSCHRQLGPTLGSAAMADGRPSRTLGFVTLPFAFMGFLVIKGQGIKVTLKVTGLTASGEVRLAAIGLNKISSKQHQGLQTLLDCYVEREALLSCTKWVEHEIKVTTSRPIKQKFDPISDKIQEVINVHVIEMLEIGVVEPSNSVWASPVVMRRKKDGKYRFALTTGK
ncbi:uncharacterized protein LOC106638928 [Copidosoma floridanum]|uniref:uncharacterized protein LOC106638928 n=1 Tax=Copidosoma floridanum TaxID=29053 RepID=UPI0006C95DD8|nr:uncharacterized protein LOC106638928 [Copidosoma floridanum]